MFAFKEPQLQFIDQNIEYLKKMEKENPSNNQLSVDLKVARERLEVARIVLLLSFADRNVAIAKRNLATAKKDKKTLKAQLQKEQSELAKSVIADRKTLSKKHKTKKSSDLDPGEDTKKEATDTPNKSKTDLAEKQEEKEKPQSTQANLSQSEDTPAEDNAKEEDA